MDYQGYQVLTIKREALDPFFLTIKPKSGEILKFIPGQFCELKLQGYNSESKRAHFFSIASSPQNLEFLEFGFKIYGGWTKRLSEVRSGSEILVKGPYGKFTWDGLVSSAVFLAGGIGITTFMSMLRFIKETNQMPSITLLYGNRTEGHIAYRKEIEEIVHTLPNSKVVHVLSDVQTDDAWSGYTGFLTKDILEKEVNFNTNPAFFVCGPPVFVRLVRDLLKQCLIEEQQIKQELF